MLLTNVCMGKRFASFYRCLAFARFWKVKFWRPFIECQYFNDCWTDFHKNIYLYIFILGFFWKPEKTWVTHWVKMMTRWPGRERWPKWPFDPVTQWPSSMSGPRDSDHSRHCIQNLCGLSTLSLNRAAAPLILWNLCNGAMYAGPLDTPCQRSTTWAHAVTVVLISSAVWFSKFFHHIGYDSVANL